MHTVAAGNDQVPARRSLFYEISVSECDNGGVRSEDFRQAIKSRLESLLVLDLLKHSKKSAAHGSLAGNEFKQQPKEFVAHVDAS